MADYKGIYYNDESKQRYFEGGAHFKYFHLYKALERLAVAQKLKLKREKIIQNKEKKKIEKNKNIKKPQEQIVKNAENSSSNVSIFIIIKYYFRKIKTKIIIIAIIKLDLIRRIYLKLMKII
jgi:hypothetical protein